MLGWILCLLMFWEEKKADGPPYSWSDRQAMERQKARLKKEKEEKKKSKFL